MEDGNAMVLVPLYAVDTNFMDKVEAAPLDLRVSDVETKLDEDNDLVIRSNGRFIIIFKEDAVKLLNWLQTVQTLGFI